MLFQGFFQRLFYTVFTIFAIITILYIIVAKIIVTLKKPESIVLIVIYGIITVILLTVVVSFIYIGITS